MAYSKTEIRLTSQLWGAILMKMAQTYFDGTLKIIHSINAPTIYSFSPAERVRFSNLFDPQKNFYFSEGGKEEECFFLSIHQDKFFQFSSRFAKEQMKEDTLRWKNTNINIFDFLGSLGVIRFSQGARNILEQLQQREGRVFRSKSKLTSYLSPYSSPYKQLLDFIQSFNILRPKDSLCFFEQEHGWLLTSMRPDAETQELTSDEFQFISGDIKSIPEIGSVRLAKAPSLCVLNERDLQFRGKRIVRVIHDLSYRKTMISALLSEKEPTGHQKLKPTTEFCVGQVISHEGNATLMARIPYSRENIRLYSVTPSCGEDGRKGLHLLPAIEGAVLCMLPCSPFGDAALCLGEVRSHALAPNPPFLDLGTQPFAIRSSEELKLQGGERRIQLKKKTEFS